MVKYTYDAWGKVIYAKDLDNNIIPETDTPHIANINPYRYRSYYYDTTKLYYLQSRYYDPEIGRFVNGDDAEMILDDSGLRGGNLYCYCHDNPVNNVDPLGLAPWSILTTIINGFLAFIMGLGSLAGKLLDSGNVKKIAKITNTSQREVVRGNKAAKKSYKRP